MTNVFGRRSLHNLSNCHKDLQAVAHEAIKHIDFTVTTGHRNKRDQEYAYDHGFSNAHYGQSPHNYWPSLAFDGYLFPIDVDDAARCRILAPVILDAAKTVGVALTWGGDFPKITGRKFVDLPHFQLTDWKRIRGKL